MKPYALRTFFARWYAQHGRSFPWREVGTSPYGILVAEMLLRQTQASMVAPVWCEFMTRYPEPAACASAPAGELFSLLSPLGLGTQRAGALQEASSALVRLHRGRVPRSIPALLSLPHVGGYAAHAVACFAFRQRVPVVDVNVMRVFSRLTGTDFGRDNRRAPGAWELAWSLLPVRRFREHNYGLLDFSAQICQPRIPACSICPLARQCAYAAGQQP